MDLRLGDHSDGRPSKLTPEVQAAVVAALASGRTYAEAAEAGGIGLRTLYSWLAKGQRRQKGDRNGDYHGFARAVRQATAQAARTAAAERNTREAEERGTQPTTPRRAESERMHFAKLLRKALHPPMPGSPEALAFEREYGATRKRLGTIAAGSAGANQEDEEDEEEQERLLTLYLRMRAHNAHNSAVLRDVISRRAPLTHDQDQEQK